MSKFNQKLKFKSFFLKFCKVCNGILRKVLNFMRIDKIFYLRWSLKYVFGKTTSLEIGKRKMMIVNAIIRLIVCYQVGIKGITETNFHHWGLWLRKLFGFWSALCSNKKENNARRTSLTDYHDLDIHQNQNQILPFTAKI